MAPTLRSSAISSPASKSIPDASDSPSKTPRKVPHCTKCGRPRQGHPREGCPYFDSPLKSKAAGAAAGNEKKLSDALSAMQLGASSPVRNNDAEERRNRRRSSLQPPPPGESLASLSTNSSAIVAGMLQHGLFGEDGDEEGGTGKNGKSEEGSDSKLGTRTAAPQVIMPCSFYPPSAASSQATVMQDFEASDDFEGFEDGVFPRVVSATARPRPLTRTMTMEQRDEFINSLNQASKATVHCLPNDDIWTLQNEASKIGLHSRIVTLSDEDGLLVLGRDEKDVKELYRKVKQQNRAGAGSGGSGLRAAAGGAVVGAAATFAGLAFA